VEHRDQVEQLAAAHRVVHQVRLFAAPQQHVVAPQVRRDVLALEHRAVGDVAGHARLAVADDGFTHAAPQAVRAHQRRAFDDFAALPGARVTPLASCVKPRPWRWCAGSRRQLPAGVQEDLVQVGAVDHAVGKP
jgi:hypothetical protein